MTSGLFITTTKPGVEKIKEFFAEKQKLEKHITDEIASFEDKYGVVVDTLRFQRESTRVPKTVYTEITIIVP